MKVLIVLISLFLHCSIFALTCDGGGYSIVINESAGEVSLNGPGVNSVSTQLRDQGNHFTASFSDGDVRSLTLAVFTNTLILVTKRGVKSVRVSCDL